MAAVRVNISEKTAPLYDSNEKAAATSDIESSCLSSPDHFKDDLPDPDMGKSEEERVELVRLFAINVRLDTC